MQFSMAIINSGACAHSVRESSQVIYALESWANTLLVLNSTQGPILMESTCACARAPYIYIPLSLD